MRSTESGACARAAAVSLRRAVAGYDPGAVSVCRALQQPTAACCTSQQGQGELSWKEFVHFPRVTSSAIRSYYFIFTVLNYGIASS